MVKPKPSLNYFYRKDAPSMFGLLFIAWSLSCKMNNPTALHFKNLCVKSAVLWAARSLGYMCFVRHTRRGVSSRHGPSQLNYIKEPFEKQTVNPYLPQSCLLCIYPNYYVFRSRWSHWRPSIWPTFPPVLHLRSSPELLLVPGWRGGWVHRCVRASNNKAWFERKKHCKIRHFL